MQTLYIVRDAFGYSNNALLNKSEFDGAVAIATLEISGIIKNALFRLKIYKR